ncbi:uncharacterized protein [Primulina eburnea]|uniref:uncharacterized protein n=1 Tax=Primulina eburnea TaxID=1245227 RepID=UPI003C6C39B2
MGEEDGYTQELLVLQQILISSFVFVTIVSRFYTKFVSIKNRRTNKRRVCNDDPERIAAQVNHLRRLIDLGDVQCIVNFRMNRNAFARLCYLLTHVGGLGESRYIRVEEKVAMFLSILAHHKKNRVIGHDYLRSGHTVSTHFHEVLRCVLKLHTLLLVKPDPVTEDCSNEAWKFFKGCLGALDGTYVNVQVPNKDKPRYRTRKGTIAVNVLAVCDRNMNFIYALTGWEGSAADARVLRDAIHREDGLKVPRGHRSPEVIMDFGTCSSTMANKVKKSEKGRRVWSAREEEVLIQSLKEAIANGWKSENGFKCGYLNFLEKAIMKIFPGTDLRGCPHINSKIHVWKKTHGTLVTMLSRSGMGWNDTQKMIEASDEAWDAFVKIDSSVKTWRFKSWPHYTDWCEIFGCDRATGGRTSTFATAVQQVLNIDDVVGPEMNIGFEDTPLNMEGGGETNSVANTTSFTASDNQKANKKKRKQATQGEELFVDAINKFTAMTKEAIAELGKRLSHDYEMAMPVSKDVLEVLEKIPGLSRDEKQIAAEILIEKPKKLALFFSLHDDEKLSFVRRISKTN